MKLLILMFTFLSLNLHAGTMAGVTMPEKIKVGGSDLVLNGMTIRKASKMGVKVKVYVGGLYLAKKSTSPADILASTSPKRMVMHYIFFRAPKSNIRNGWKDAFNDHCGSDCKSERVHLKTFNKQVVTMTKNDKMILDFNNDKLTVTLEKKKKTTKVEIVSKKFTQIILKAFVNAKNKSFVDPLLGKVVTAKK